MFVFLFPSIVYFGFQFFRLLLPYFFFLFFWLSRQGYRRGGWSQLRLITGDAKTERHSRILHGMFGMGDRLLFSCVYTIGGGHRRELLSVFTWRILQKIFYVVMCNSFRFLFWLSFMWVCIVWKCLSFLLTRGFLPGMEGDWLVCRVVYDFNVG